MNVPLFEINAAPWSPWIIYGAGNDSSIRGVAIEIYEAMRKRNIFNYVIQKKGLYGGGLVNGKFTGLVGSMVANQTDVGGPLFMSEERARAVQYSSAIDYCKIGIMSGMVPANKNPFLVFGIFSFQVWILILLSIFLSAGAACFIYSILPSYHQKKTVEAFLRFLWMFEASLLGKEFGINSRFFLRHIWNAPSFKLLQGMWIMSCLVLTYTYQGTIISTYAADKMKPKYENFDDLMADPQVIIGSHENSYPLLCLNKLANTTYDDIYKRVQRNILKPFSDLPTLDAVEEGRTVYVFDFGYCKYLVGEWFRKTGKCGMRVTPVDYCATSVGIVNRKGLPEDVLEKLNDGIMRFFEAALPHRFFMETLLFYDICTSHAPSATKPLTLSDLLGAFTVLVSGLVMALLCLILEIKINHRKLIQTQGDSAVDLEDK
ncbi:hypothetical protein JTE90_013955 [Oedothorax gibbosus]|uniref:Ionotropic glutamate receptor C-terminal domain-containing protein n=1 Tax=Oedothorax gibbosus TaxID=931172 RepID=A0AAV6UDE4_9ARAC|nr:hypothetical protein JTE90_013955 [Oedothorax gibbosus]